MEKKPILWALGILVLVLGTIATTQALRSPESFTYLLRAGKGKKAVLYLWPAAKEVSKGEKFELKIMLDTQEEESGGADLVLKYDPGSLNLVGNTIEPGLIFDAYKDRRVDTRKGLVSLRASGSFKGNGTLAKVAFEGLKEGETPVKLLLGGAFESSAVWGKEEKIDILRGVNNAKVIITQ